MTEQELAYIYGMSERDAHDAASAAECDSPPSASTLLRELAHNVAAKARRYQDRGQHERGLMEVAASVERWLERRAPLLPGYSPDWPIGPDGRKVYAFPWEEGE